MIFSRSISAVARPAGFGSRSSRTRLSRSTTVALRQPAFSSRRFIHIEQRLKELGLDLPPPAPPRANYNSVCQGPGSNMLYISGHLPFQLDGKTLITGRIGEDGRGVEYGYEAAWWVGLNIIATLKDQLGDLDRVEKVIKVRMTFGLCNDCFLYSFDSLIYCRPASH